jgi:hypothetical protein
LVDYYYGGGETPARHAFGSVCYYNELVVVQVTTFSRPLHNGKYFVGAAKNIKP